MEFQRSQYMSAARALCFEDLEGRLCFKFEPPFKLPPVIPLVEDDRRELA